MRNRALLRLAAPCRAGCDGAYAEVAPARRSITTATSLVRPRTGKLQVQHILTSIKTSLAPSSINIHAAQRGFPQTRTLRHSSPSVENGTKTPPSTKRNLFRGSLICASILGLYLYLSPASDKIELNTTRFTPYTIKSITPLPNSTAFLLTLNTPKTALLADAWRHGLWSVEFKQPQLQIARNYTPLPPTSDEQGLQFFIRQYDGGEVSTYLSRLQPGDKVELRGPHLGFDLGSRLGSKGGKVVFLAGGTGIAPALQAARWLLVERSGEEAVEILWANRNAADCSGCPRVTGGSSGRWWWSSTSKSEGHDTEAEEPSVVVKQIQALQSAYERKGRKLEVKCAVDGEGGKITAQHIRAAVAGSSSGTSPSLASSSTCYFHTQKLLEHTTEEADVASRQERPCNCSPGGSGKNLFLISGPEGFVSAFVGPKVWAEGAERQGPLGGVVAELIKKEPGLWKDWLVLKQ